MTLSHMLIFVVVGALEAQAGLYLEMGKVGTCKTIVKYLASFCSIILVYSLFSM